MEKLTLVTSWDSLKVSDFVCLKPCPFCKARGGHRGIILSFIRNARGTCPDGSTIIGDAFALPPSCSPTGQRDLVSQRTVALKLVYLIDTGLETTTETTAAHKIPATKRNESERSG